MITDKFSKFSVMQCSPLFWARVIFSRHHLSYLLTLPVFVLIVIISSYISVLVYSCHIHGYYMSMTPPVIFP
jgi:hypothetical protein